MDMSKAFDKVCHSRMLQKLRVFGFGGSLLRWFGSYLTNRCLKVLSLVQLYFLLYVNDLPDAVKTNNIAMFADDTKTYQEIKSVDDVASSTYSFKGKNLELVNAECDLAI